MTMIILALETNTGRRAILTNGGEDLSMSMYQSQQAGKGQDIGVGRLHRVEKRMISTRLGKKGNDW